MAGGQHEPQPRGRAHEQQLQLAQRLGRAQLVHVVDHQPDPVLEPAQIGQQPLDDRPAVQIGSRRQRPDQLRPGRPCPAARRAPTARTAAGRALRPAPAPTRPAPPGRSRRSRSAPGASSRFPAAPTPRLRARPHPAARKARAGRRPRPAPREPPEYPAAPDRLAGPTAPSSAGPALTLRPLRATTGISRPAGRPQAVTRDASCLQAQSPGRVTPAHPAGREACSRSKKTKRNWSLL